jgi:tRNA nucleotidyltransferase/poly(A) polymerase
MLRAIQFAARFDFEIEPKTMQEIKKNAKKITTVSPTRFQEEFRKMFEKANKPTVGVDLLIETGIMPLILSKGKSNPLMDKLDKKAFPTFLALLAEDYGEAAGETIQTLMKVSKVDTKAIQAVVDFQKIPFTNISIIQFLKDRANLDYVIQHIDALLKAQGKGALSDKLKDMKGGGMPTKRNELAVSGRDLLDVGLKGRQIGEAIEYLMGVAVNSKNEKEHLINEAKREFGISKMSWEDLLWR